MTSIENGRARRGLDRRGDEARLPQRELAARLPKRITRRPRDAVLEGAQVQVRVARREAAHGLGQCPAVDIAQVGQLPAEQRAELLLRHLGVQPGGPSRDRPSRSSSAVRARRRHARRAARPRGPRARARAGCARPGRGGRRCQTRDTPGTPAHAGSTFAGTARSTSCSGRLASGRAAASRPRALRPPAAGRRPRPRSARRAAAGSRGSLQGEGARATVPPATRRAPVVRLTTRAPGAAAGERLDAFLAMTRHPGSRRRPRLARAPLARSASTASDAIETWPRRDVRLRADLLRRAQHLAQDEVEPARERRSSRALECVLDLARDLRLADRRASPATRPRGSGAATRRRRSGRTARAGASSTNTLRTIASPPMRS
jgi:hypothetical protein